LVATTVRCPRKTQVFRGPAALASILQSLSRAGHAPTTNPHQEISGMNTKKALIVSAMGGLFALGQLGASAEPAPTPKFDAEKCYGLAKAGKNDCAANGHACQGQAKAEANAKEWIYVPKGTCERIANGSLAAK
jgi:uncharacterized membrane protein